MKVPEIGEAYIQSFTRLMEDEGKLGFAAFIMEMNWNLLCLPLLFFLLLQVNTLGGSNAVCL